MMWRDIIWRDIDKMFDDIMSYVRKNKVSIVPFDEPLKGMIGFTVLLDDTESMINEVMEEELPRWLIHVDSLKALKVFKVPGSHRQELIKKHILTQKGRKILAQLFNLSRL
jgi:hypothetical protein